MWSSSGCRGRSLPSAAVRGSSSAQQNARLSRFRGFRFTARRQRRERQYWSHILQFMQRSDCLRIYTAHGTARGQGFHRQGLLEALKMDRAHLLVRDVAREEPLDTT